MKQLWIIVGIAVPIAFAGCGSSSSKSEPLPAQSSDTRSGTAAPTSVGPGAVSGGHDSPGAAAVGFWEAIQAQNYPLACSYAVPSQQDRCNQSLPGLAATLTNPTITNLSALGIVMSPAPVDRAIVVLGGTFCTATASAGPHCVTNNDPTSGVPKGESFDSQYNHQFAQTGTPFGGLFSNPAQNVAGKWYIPIGI